MRARADLDRLAALAAKAHFADRDIGRATFQVDGWDEAATSYLLALVKAAPDLLAELRAARAVVEAAGPVVEEGHGLSHLETALAAYDRAVAEEAPP